MRQSEFPHNSPEQTKQYIRAALALVEKLDPPEDLRVAVFENACKLYSAKQIVMEQVAPMMALPPNARPN